MSDHSYESYALVRCCLLCCARFEDESPVRDHSSERAVRSCGAVCFSIKVEISFFNHCLC